MAGKVTQEAHDAAREYVRRRFENEVSFSSALDDVLGDGVDRICNIISRYGISGEQLMNGQIPRKAQLEIDGVIRQIAEELADDVLLLSQDERDDRDWFIAFMKREYEDGWHFDERLNLYTKNFGKQVIMAIAALSLLDVSSVSWATSIKGNLRDIYNAGFVKAARPQRLSYFSPIGMGRGVPHSMAVAIDYLCRQEIANAWMEWEYSEVQSRGALGYHVYRGSNYPCVECEHNAARFHPISEGLCVPSHGHCCCYVVYIYQ